MIGRATIGNPWIFKEIIQGLKDGTKKGQTTFCPPSNEERLHTILEHLELMIQEKGEYVAIREMRKHISGSTKKLPNSSKFREEMNKIEDKNELIKFITEYLKN